VDQREEEVLKVDLLEKWFQKKVACKRKKTQEKPRREGGETRLTVSKEKNPS